MSTTTGKHETGSSYYNDDKAMPIPEGKRKVERREPEEIMAMSLQGVGEAVRDRSYRYKYTFCWYLKKDRETRKQQKKEKMDR